MVRLGCDFWLFPLFSAYSRLGFAKNIFSGGNGPQTDGRYEGQVAVRDLPLEDLHTSTVCMTKNELERYVDESTGEISCDSPMAGSHNGG